MKADLAKRYQDDGMAVMSKPQLILGLYERLMTDLDRATTALVNASIEQAHDALVHAQDIVHELNLALDVDRWDGGHNLRAIYNHANALLIEANVTKSPDPVRHCTELLAPLNEAWHEAAAAVATERSAVAQTNTAGTVRMAG